MNDTLLLRAIAILLITNSHIDQLYPWPKLGTGGSLGNSIFFFLSGLGIALSWRYAEKTKVEKNALRRWFPHRFGRLYLPVFIFVTVFLLIVFQGWKTWSYQDYFNNYIIVKDYWFILSLLVFYLLVFPVLKYYRSIKPYLIYGSLIVIYFTFYLTMVDLDNYTIEKNGFFRWIFYFGTMLFGIQQSFWYETKESDLRNSSTAFFIKCFIGLLFTTVLYFASLYMMSRNDSYSFQFIIHVLTIPFLWLSFKVACHKITSDIINTKLLKVVVWFIGTLTLEIYLTQRPVRTSELILDMLFPLNIIVFAVITLLLSYLLRQLTNVVRPGPSKLGKL